jgi:hypothetical protein
MRFKFDGKYGSKYVFVRFYKNERGIEVPRIALWSASEFNTPGAYAQYPGNTVIIYAGEYDAAKRLATQYFESR